MTPHHLQAHAKASLPTQRYASPSSHRRRTAKTAATILPHRAEQGDIHDDQCHTRNCRSHQTPGD
ncbi:MAG: hypothetical protein JWQ08_1399 [Deinococcus sp.]|nr:hypothetical protein [Deinococcus sp.]